MRNIGLERRAVMAWVEGELSPNVAHSLTFLSRRPSGQGRIEWDVFACLYPEEPHYRLHTRRSVSVVEAGQILAEVKQMRLPRDVSTKYDAGRVRSGLEVMVPISRRRHVPLGMYVTGRFHAARDGGSCAVGALWHASVLETAFVLERLQRAAKEA